MLTSWCAPHPASPASIILVSRSPSISAVEPSSTSKMPLIDAGPSLQESTIVDAAALDKELWEAWITKYGEGSWGNDIPPPPPMLPRNSVLRPVTPFATPPLDYGPALTPTSPELPPSFELHTCSPSSPFAMDDTCLDRSPAALLAFYRQNGYFPAPPGANEAMRLQVINKYGLRSFQRRSAIDRICRIAKLHFKVPTVVITLIFEGSAVLAGELGWDDDKAKPLSTPLREIPMTSSICTHGITRRDGVPWVLPDLKKDWRFKDNPSVKDGLAFMASANINLPTGAEAGTDAPSHLPVGTICVIDQSPRDRDFAFDSASLEVLKDLADLVAREFQLGFETTRRETETLQSAYVASLLKTALVYPSASLPSATAPNVKSIVDLFAEVSTQLCKLTSADHTAIVDVRSYRPSTLTSATSPKVAYTTFAPTAGHRRSVSVSASGSHGAGAAAASAPGGPSTAFASKLYKEINILASTGTINWEEMISEDGPHFEAISRCLDGYYITDGVPAVDTDIQNPLSYLSSSFTDTICVPVLDHNSFPALFIVLCSEKEHFKFDPADYQFVNCIGGITVGALLREKANESTFSKISFVSSLSHELRTPIHGARSQIELMREFASPEELTKLSPLLLASETCLDTLRDVLDDVLEFGRLSSSYKSAEELEVVQQRSLKEIDLEKLIEDVTLATWVRKRRVDIVSRNTLNAEEIREKVDVILEIEDRSDGWLARVDVGGIKRILLNLLGNALKFTATGHVKISMRRLSVGHTPGALLGGNCCVIEVEDTGVGMSEQFLRNSVFLPFTQQDSFCDGAGLGLSICETIIRRMGGKISVESTLGMGTTMKISFPVEPLPSSITEPTALQKVTTSSRPGTANDTSSRTPRKSSFRYRIISDELSTLFDPATPALLLAATPPFEKDGFKFDFKSAIERSQRWPPAMKLPKSIGSDATSSAAAVQDVEARPSISVLVADDNRIALNIMARLLSGKSIPFVQAENGQQAVAAYKARTLPSPSSSSSSFQLVILDLQMPILDGLGAAIEIRAFEQEQKLDRCRIVVLSGLSHDVDVAAGLVDQWIVKGGKSLSLIMQEIALCQERLAATPLLPPPPVQASTLAL